MISWTKYIVTRGIMHCIIINSELQSQWEWVGPGQTDQHKRGDRPCPLCDMNGLTVFNKLLHTIIGDGQHLGINTILILIHNLSLCAISSHC